MNLKKNSSASDIAKLINDLTQEGKIKNLILEIIKNIENISDWTGVEDFEPIGSYVFLKEEKHILSKSVGDVPNNAGDVSEGSRRIKNFFIFLKKTKN